MHSCTRAVAVLCSAALSLSVAAHADENIFGYTYGAETLPKGKWEAYGWFTGRFDKGMGHYSGFDFKQEIEFGITDRLQMSLYINERYHNFSGNALEEEEEHGGAEAAEAEEAQAGEAEEHEDGKRKHSRFAYDGNQISLKYMLLSPFKDPIGLALYLEPGYSLVEKISGERVLEWELEAKLIAQKNFLDDQLITSLNLTAEFEWERARPSHGEDFDGEMIWEVTGGVSYRVARNWYVGIEARYHTEFPNMNINDQEHWAIFVGPSIHYGGERWWATLTWLPQVTGWPNDPERSNNLHFGEHERNEVRFKIGYNF